MAEERNYMPEESGYMAEDRGKMEEERLQMTEEGNYICDLSIAVLSANTCYLV